MKHSTKYLFDVDRDFFEPELTLVAKKKVVTASLLKQKISTLKQFASEEEMPELIIRYDKADEAFKHWTKILEED